MTSGHLPLLLFFRAKMLGFLNFWTRQESWSRLESSLTPN